MPVEPERTRNAACSCGQLSAVVTGEPTRVSICHCAECQRRTGSVFGAQARFPASKVTTVGRSATYTRKADSGSTLSFHFCPACGSTVYYYNDAVPGFVGVPLGAFADPSSWTPAFSVYERTKHAWVVPPTGSARSRE